MWNSAMTGEAKSCSIAPVAYGNRAATIFAAARATPGYTPSSFDLVLGSQAVNPGWTSSEMASSSGYDSVDAAPYLFNSLNDVSSNEAIFGPMFAQPEQADEPSVSSRQLHGTTGASGCRRKFSNQRWTIYEVNLSTVSGIGGLAERDQSGGCRGNRSGASRLPITCC